MSQLRLGFRLAGRDLRRRATETVLLFIALVVAATTLTIGLVLHGQTEVPYAMTRARTVGPDIVSSLFPAPNTRATPAGRARLQSIAEQREVSARSRQFPTTWTAIAFHGVSGVAEVQGRDPSSSPVDRPAVVTGRWDLRGGVVVERAFAQAMGLSVGDRVDLGGHSEHVVGVAVSAALPPYPQLCTIGCILDRPGWSTAQPGLVWTTRQGAAALSTAEEPLVWFQYLRLRDPGSAPAFARRFGSAGPPVGRPQLDPWQAVADRQAEQLANERAAVIFGSTLLVILALATLVVLVGGRMTDEVRRVGMLKAAGAGPGFIANLLLTSYLAIGLVASLIGLAFGRLLAPKLIGLSSGLLGHLGPTRVTPAIAAVVVVSVLALVLLAVVPPAWRAARTSTIRALADVGHSPRRHGLVVAVSRRLPAPALLGLRLAVRRPRRAVLTTLAIAVVVCAGVVVLLAQAHLHAERGNAGGPADPQLAQLHTVTTALTVLLGVMAAVNLLFITRASALDSRRVLAVARAVGVTPGQAAAAFALSQLLPALFGLALGGVVGASLFGALSSSSHATAAAIPQLAVLAVLTLTVTLLLTALPARLEARRPIAPSLQGP